MLSRAAGRFRTRHLRTSALLTTQNSSSPSACRRSSAPQYRISARGARSTRSRRAAWNRFFSSSTRCVHGRRHQRTEPNCARAGGAEPGLAAVSPAAICASTQLGESLRRPTPEASRRYGPFGGFSSRRRARHLRSCRRGVCHERDARQVHTLGFERVTFARGVRAPARPLLRESLEVCDFVVRDGAVAEALGYP
jgi:hypothetical protein